MRVSYDAAMEVASHEAIIRQTYLDSVAKDTWSVGLTSATGHDVERYIGKPQPLKHCLTIYVWALDNYADHVREVFDGHDLTKEQFAAALSFTWNLGGGALKRATWVKHFKAGNMKAAERAIKAWNKAGGKVNEGLKTRRAAEADLMFRGVWSHDGTMTEYTRLTSGRTPVWSSAEQIDVEAELRAVIGTKVEPDHDPKPDAEVDAPTVTPEKKPRPATYTVKRGDVLSVIAARHDVTVAEISEANDIARPDRIQVGQVLRIPGGSAPDLPEDAPKGNAIAAVITLIAAAIAGAVGWLAGLFGG